MNKLRITVFGLLLCFSVILSAQNSRIAVKDTIIDGKVHPDFRIDNMGYWKKMAELGLVKVAPKKAFLQPVYTSTKINATFVKTEDSPDVLIVDDANVTQSENSIFVSPITNEVVLNSNNSTPYPASSVYGANHHTTNDGGETWGGSIYGSAGGNSGDPAALVGLSGRMFNGHIHSNSGQGVAYSDNNGVSWTEVLVAPAPSGYGNMLDKNHLWIDNSTSSPFEGNLYDAWTAFGGPNDYEIELARSTDGGVSWSTPINISSAVNAGSHCQGVNLKTGPNGEVYAVWAIYDNWYGNGDEEALGFAKSSNGGQSFDPATRILSNIRGIRTSGTSKNMRVNSFPSMDVDISGGQYNGNIYVVWANIGVPGINTGNDIDVYIIRSEDQGQTWSIPIRVNQDPVNLGNEHFFPWITCDPVTGVLSIVFYDDRNVGGNQLEVFAANSYDGGETWEDFKISDVSFTPAPISGLATDYFGDYLGISARDGKVFPCWTDNRTGVALTYTSPYETIPSGQPYIIYNGHQINDATANNNGMLDFGESVSLSVQMINIGDSLGKDLDLVLQSNSPYIEIFDSIGSIDSLYSGDSILLMDEFSFKVSDTVPGNKSIPFIISASDMNYEWNKGFSIEAHAPLLNVEQIQTNIIQGNGDAFMDPGETVEAVLPTKNIGNYNAEDSKTSLFSTSPFILISENFDSLGLIEPDEIKSSSFLFTIDSNATPNHYFDLIYKMKTGNYTTYQVFFMSIGNVQVDEDFETGDFNKFEWAFGGNAPWEIDSVNNFEGSYCAKSGSILDNQSTELIINIESFADDTLSFYRKISSEASYDFLEFYIDGVKMEEWSGFSSWQKFSYPVNAGSHQFKWRYFKDVFVSSGDDCGYIDMIEFPPIKSIDIPLQVNAIAVDTFIRAGEYTQLYAMPIGGSGTYTIQWSPDSTITNAEIYNPYAFPSVNTTYEVFVNDGDTLASDSVIIEINSIGLKRLWPSASVKVYPNPFTSSFFIELLETMDTDEVIIINNRGKCVKKIDNNHFYSNKLKVNTEGLENGIYYLIINSNNKIFVNKLIKIK